MTDLINGCFTDERIDLCPSIYSLLFPASLVTDPEGTWTWEDPDLKLAEVAIDKNEEGWITVQWTADKSMNSIKWAEYLSKMVH